MTLPGDRSLAGARAELTISPSSWDSGLALRDTNVKDVFFRVAEHPSMTFVVDAFPGLSGATAEVGGVAEGVVNGKLSAFGKVIDVAAPVRVARTAEDAFTVDSTEPFVISIASLGLDGPLAELMKVCGHKSVDDTVKVSVHLAIGAHPPAP